MKRPSFLIAVMSALLALGVVPDNANGVKPANAQGISSVVYNAMRHLWSLAVSAASTEYWGTWFMDDEYFDWELRFFREWEADHLPSRQS